MKQMKLYEEMLIKRKSEVIKILDDLENETSGVSHCDIKEDGDFASCSTSSENNYRIFEKLRYELKEIEEALLNISAGEYGVCKMCEENINPERLYAKPYAKYCIDCREFVEKEAKKC